MMRRFRPTEQGVELRLSPEEIEALVMIPELLASVGSVEGDPAAERLAINTYPDDEGANAEFLRLMGPELDSGRAADRSAVLASLERPWANQ